MGNNVHFFRKSSVLQLVAQYDFNNNLIDSVGGNNGTGTDITYNSGSFGNEAVFNGSTSEVRTPNSTVWDISNGTNDVPIKIETIVKMNSTSDQFVIAKCPSNGQGWEIIKFSSLVYLNIYDYLTTGFIQVSCDLQTDINGYSYIVTSYDGSGSEYGLNISVNGLSTSLVRNRSNYTKTAQLNTNTTFGRTDRSTVRKLNGAISQIKVYK